MKSGRDGREGHTFRDILPSGRLFLYVHFFHLGTESMSNGWTVCLRRMSGCTRTLDSVNIVTGNVFVFVFVFIFITVYLLRQGGKLILQYNNITLPVKGLRLRDRLRVRSPFFLGAP